MLKYKVIAVLDVGEYELDRDLSREAALKLAEDYAVGREAAYREFVATAVDDKHGQPVVSFFPSSRLRSTYVVPEDQDFARK